MQTLDKTQENAKNSRQNTPEVRLSAKNTHDNARYIVQETQENARENTARPPYIRLL